MSLEAEVARILEELKHLKFQEGYLSAQLEHCLTFLKVSEEAPTGVSDAAVPLEALRIVDKSHTHRIYAVFQEHPELQLSAKEVTSRTGIPRPSVTVLMNRMHNTGALQRVSHGRYRLGATAPRVVPHTRAVQAVNE